MHIQVDIDETLEEASVLIRAPRLSDDVQRVLDCVRREAPESPDLLAVEDGDRTVFVKPEDVVMVRVERGVTRIYAAGKAYTSRRRLYELAEALGPVVIQISKQTLVNLAYVRAVEPTLGASLKILLAGGLHDYISRTYLKDFKARIGL